MEKERKNREGRPEEEKRVIRTAGNEERIRRVTVLLLNEVQNIDYSAHMCCRRLRHD